MIQKFFKSILPKATFDKIEAESKKWFMECPRCGFSISYWDAGGIRAYASNIGKQILGFCPKCCSGCKKLVFFKVIKKT